MTSAKGVGLPIKLLHESEGHIVTVRRVAPALTACLGRFCDEHQCFHIDLVETKNGELYRGELYEAEDNWNCQMREVQMTARNGQQRIIQHIYIRGSKIRFIIVPDMMKTAPMFKRVDPKQKNDLPGMGATGYARKNHVKSAPRPR